MTSAAVLGEQWRAVAETLGKVEPATMEAGANYLEGEDRTTDSRRAMRTLVIPTSASPRPKLTPKKKRKAETAAFMLVAEAPSSLICSWKRRRSSALA